nr:von Willebrand factor type A domain-containing protein [uncultured Capnocytophaga sp.]
MKQFLILLFLAIGNLWAQEFEVTGIVTQASDKTPLLYASVVIKGTIEGVVTDMEGKYTIKVKKGDILQFSFIGFKTKEVKITSQKVIDIALDEDDRSLDEVVVTGYNIQRKEAYTASIPVVGLGRHKRGASKLRKSKKILTETYKAIDENNFKSTTTDPVTTFAADVDNASYSNVRRMIEDGDKPEKDAVRIEELINYFDYSYNPPAKDSTNPLKATTTLSTCAWNNQNYLLRIGLQAKTIDLRKAPASNIVFLIDTSGSMDEPDKMPLLKESFKLLLESLRPEDKVAIVVYASETGIVLPSTSAKEKEKILKVINSLEAQGSTAGGEGIQEAYRIARENYIPNGNNRIILATDGDFNVGVRSEGELERLVTKERKSGVYISVLGFGMGNYRDDMLETIANKGNGNYAYIDNLKEAKKVLVKEFGGTLYTVAKDVKLQLEFNPQYVKEYRQIGYENRALENEDFKDDGKDAGEIGAGHTVTVLYELVPAQGNKTNELRYQKQDTQSHNGELGFLKIRYKSPFVKRAKSIELTEPIPFILTELNKTDNDYRFATAVAQFGMLLRNSKHKGTATYGKVIELANTALGKDENGYRKEFVELVEEAEDVMNDN